MVGMDEQRRRLQSALDGLLRDRQALTVLEAGCGSATHVALPERAHVVGIDISQAQLDKNSKLDERILGDIQTYRLPPPAFDLIICWDVLEHVAHPERALSNFEQALRRDGLLLLVMPSAGSLKARITKHTPTWFHTWVYRHVYGIRGAGTEGQGPFPTYMAKPMHPRSLKTFAESHQLRIEYFSFSESMYQISIRRNILIY